MVGLTSKHPECGSREAYLTDVSTGGSMEVKEFDLLKNSWATARLGVNSYGCKDEIIVGKRPVFVSIDEMISKTPITP